MTTPADTELSFSGKKKKKQSSELVDGKTKDSTDNLDPLDFGTKKKKKSKPLELKDDETGVKTDGDATKADEVKPTKKKIPPSGEEVNDLAGKLDEELSFDFKKKKKKIRAVDLEEPVTSTDVPETDNLSKENVEASVYTYDMLLSRIFTQMGAQNPELMSDQKRRLVMAPPGMARVGSKKTGCLNFSTIAAQLNRDPSHLMAYVLAELGTQGSIDANGALLIRGRYQNKHMESVLRNYYRTYVKCTTCQSAETDLCKDSRLMFVQCRRCNSRVTVKNVTSGFQALTGRRAAMRAKIQ